MDAVTNHTAEYYLRWHSRCGSEAFEDSGMRQYFSRLWRTRPDLPELHAALVLLAAGQGPARLPTCEQALQRVWIRSDPETDAVAPTVLLRLLSLFRPHELRALRIAEGKACTFVVSLLMRGDAVGLGLSQALASLSALECPRPSFPDPDPRIALIERHAATMRELNCIGVRSESKVMMGQAVARCTLLESLVSAYSLSPSVWLPLSHLHTLRGVHLGAVTISAIAAALPRLHTFEAVHSLGAAPAASFAGFFEDLLPRLRVFHFRGEWPDTEVDAAVAAEPIGLHPLEELVLAAVPHQPAFRFVGLVQPMALRVHTKVIDQWLTSDAAAARDWFPLARLRTLYLFSGSLRAHQVSQILRAAPQLQTLTIYNADVDGCWYLNVKGPTPLAFIGLQHYHLRYINLLRLRPASEDLPVGCATRLRQQHFPRLVSITSDQRRQFATQLDHEARVSFPHRVVTLLARVIPWDLRMQYH